MTNPFQSISEPSGQKLFDEALQAVKAKPHASSNGPAEPPPDDGEQSPRIESGLGANARASTLVAQPPQWRPPLRGGLYAPADALLLLNLHYFVGQTPFETAVYRLYEDGRATYVSPEQFKLEVQNIFVRGAHRNVAVEKFWKEHKDRHQRQIVFKPGGTTDPQEFNLWKDFGVEQRHGWAKQRRLVRHIWIVICRRNKKKFKYLMRWLAWAVQNPDQQACAVIVLKSRREGTGKSTIGVVMLKIFGQHGALVDDSERLLGRFNDWLETTSFVLAEEILWANDRRTADKLKSRITSDTLQIERKNGAIRQVANRLHMIMTTNHDHAIGAGTGDRRFVVFDVSDEHANDKAWFDPLYQDLKDGGAGQFLHLLQNLKIDPWHPRQIIKTEEATEQQRMSGDTVSQWAQACIIADAVIGGARGPYGSDTSHDLGTSVSFKDLLTAYAGFCNQNGQRALSTEAFGKACADMFGPRRRLKALQTPTGSGLQTSTGKGTKRRPWGYHVPKGNKWQEKVDDRLGIKK